MAGAREKLIVTLVFLLAVNTTPAEQVARVLAWLVLLAAAIVVTRVRPVVLLRRTGGAMLFALPVLGGVLIWRDPQHATGTALRILVSVGAAVVLASTTRADRLIQAARRLGCPHGLSLVLQFLVRYSHVLAAQAARMRQAHAARAGGRLRGKAARAAAGGALATLWLSASERSERIHRAMLARGYDGEIRLLDAERGKRRDYAVTAAAVVLIAAIRWWPWNL